MRNFFMFLFLCFSLFSQSFAFNAVGPTSNERGVLPLDSTQASLKLFLIWEKERKNGDMNSINLFLNQLISTYMKEKGKKKTELKVLIICDHVDVQFKQDCLNECNYLPKQLQIKHWQSVELSKETDHSLKKQLSNIDIVYVPDGNIWLLYSLLLKNGAAKIIQSKIVEDGIVYFGEGCGTRIASKHILKHFQQHNGFTRAAFDTDFDNMISGADRFGLNLYHGYSFVNDRISKNIFNFESGERCIQNHQKHLIKFKKSHGLLINGNHKAKCVFIQNKNKLDQNLKSLTLAEKLFDKDFAPMEFIKKNVQNNKIELVWVGFILIIFMFLGYIYAQYSIPKTYNRKNNKFSYFYSNKSIRDDDSLMELNLLKENYSYLSSNKSSSSGNISHSNNLMSYDAYCELLTRHESEITTLSSHNSKPKSIVIIPRTHVFETKSFYDYRQR